MSFMEIDDDLDCDPITSFLKNKLAEIKSEKTKLGQSLAEIQQKIEKELVHGIDESALVSVDKCWIKIVHEKYAIAYRIKNNSKRPLEKSKPILRWNLNYPISYSSYLFHVPEDDSYFEREFDAIHSIGNKTLLVIVMDRPSFLEQLSISVSGILHYQLGEGSYLSKIPDVTLNSYDITDSEISVPMYRLIEYKITDFVSCLACSLKINLVQKLIENIYSHFEIDASLYRMNIGNDRNSNRFFLAHKLSPSFDGCILEIKEENMKRNFYIITIYYRDHDTLLAFLHHLYRNVECLSLLPENMEAYLHLKIKQECEEELIKCIEDEIQLAKKCSKDSNEINTFRRKLTDLEYETDKAYIQLSVAADEEKNEDSIVFRE